MTSDQIRCEMEATWFAIGFLMPKQAFREFWQEHPYDLSKVASHFGVPMPMALARARELGLVSAPIEPTEWDFANV